MKTFDLTSKITAERLNESMFKKFGQRINFNKYTREQLEDYRNLLRTKLNQAEVNSNFNDLLTNETYQKDKYMMDVINTKIKEMLGESKVLAEKSKSQKQARTMAAAAHDPSFAKKVGIKQSVAKEFNKADTGTKQLSKAMKNKKNKAEEGIEENTMNKKNNDGNLANNAKPYNKVTRGDVIAGRLGKDEKGGKAKKVKESGDTSSRYVPQSKSNITTRKITGKGAYGSGGSSELTNIDKDDFESDKKAKKTKKVKESTLIFRRHVAIVNESLGQLLREDEEGKAKAITAASDMVNDFTSWMQRVGQYQTKSMIELADSIRAEFGPEESEAFKNTVAPSLAATLETLTSNRETISHAVAVLAGEATDAAAMGQEPGMEEPGMEMEPGVEPGGEEVPGDDGLDAATAGGQNYSNREMRESKQQSRARKLAESHSLMRSLSK